MIAPVKTHQGYLLGRKYDPAQVIALCHAAGPRWRGEILITAAAVCLSESAGREKARCENFIDGVHVSTDFGLFEHNYSVDKITPELLAKVYDPAWNVRRAYERWENESFKPWHGYTRNIATNPEMRGKYIQRAIWGYMNFERVRFGMKGVPSPYLPFGPQRLTWWLEHPDEKS